MSDKNQKNEEFEPGDAITLFYVFFGMVIFLPYTIGFILFHSPSQLGWFAYHPPLLAIGISLLAYGITVLQPTTRPASTARGLQSHQLWLGGLALPVLLTGAALQYQQKENLGREHFTTWHSYLGAIGASALIGQALFGALLGGGLVSAKYKRLHRLSGYLLFSIISLTFALGGLYSDFVVNRTWSFTRNTVYGLGTLSIWGGVVTRARPKKLF